MHSRTAPGTIRAISVDKAGLFSWRLWAQRFVCSVTRRRGGPPAHRPSSRGPGCGFASDRVNPQPSQAGGGFGLWLRSPVWIWRSLWRHEIKLRRKQGPTGAGVFLAFVFWVIGGNWKIQSNANFNNFLIIQAPLLAAKAIAISSAS